MKLFRLPLTSSWCILELNEKFGSPGMKPAHKPDEDGEVIQLHFNILKQEMRKATPDLQLCRRKMERSFTYRHKRRYNPEVSVAQIFEEIPTLRYKNFLAIEAKSLNVASPGEMWDKLHGSIIHLMKFSKPRSKNYHQFHSRYLENLDSTLKGQERKDDQVSNSHFGDDGKVISNLHQRGESSQQQHNKVQ
ncbi:uncharacterized protein LOC135098487 [Scylla paramamosain]|uniref:uncharacterized protein LOC135098487 n=1 Tax=Scylla paramamosain TaxID=85552 RepID=UPI0030834324